MKISIVVSLLILAIGTGFGWQDHQRLAAMREACVQLRAKAARLGVITHPADSTRLTKHSREDRDAAAGVIAARLIALEQEMDALPEGEASHEKLRIESERLRAAMDATQLKILIAAIRADTELSKEPRENLIFGALTDLCLDQPESALGILADTPTLLEGGPGGYVISSALGRWARQDPRAAIDWLRKNRGSFPDVKPEGHILVGAATHDPKLAFQLIGELGLKNDSTTIREITATAGSPEGKTAVLTALRGHMATLDDATTRESVGEEGLRELSRDLGKDGFQAATDWISSAGLEPQELNTMLKGMQTSAKISETGQWVEWIGSSTLAGKSDDTILSMVTRWTREDYQAAGKWLAAAPAGDTRNISIRAYAETLSSHEPEAAAQWAVTLPEGKDREKTLRRIYQNWPKDAPASRDAAEAFKNQHGIK